MPNPTLFRPGSGFSTRSMTKACNRRAQRNGSVGVETRRAMKTNHETSAYVGRDVMSAAAKQGVKELREASWMHAPVSYTHLTLPTSDLV